MRTKFDELVEEATDSVKKANKLLKEALDEDTWGFNDMEEEYLINLEQVQHQLALLLRTKLK